MFNLHCVHTGTTASVFTPPHHTNMPDPSTDKENLGLCPPHPSLHHPHCAPDWPMPHCLPSPCCFHIMDACFHELAGLCPPGAHSGLHIEGLPWPRLWDLGARCLLTLCNVFSNPCSAHTQPRLLTPWPSALLYPLYKVVRMKHIVRSVGPLLGPRASELFLLRFIKPKLFSSLQKLTLIL